MKISTQQLSDIKCIDVCIQFLKYFTSPIVCQIHGSQNPMLILQQTLVLLESIIPFFVASMISEEITQQIDKIDFYVDSDFYKFPNDILRMLPFIIANTQQLCVFKSYGKAVCNRESFKEVTI